MIEHYKSLIVRQYEAALCMLGACVDRCSDADWHAPVANLKFSQAAFHALLFTDLYLGSDVVSLRSQPFHRRHADVFADYEEFENRPQRALYDKPFVKMYLQFCRDKAAEVVASETAESLEHSSGFQWLEISRAEVHVYNVRHIHHHAAQLSLHLRLRTGEGIPWVGSGWRDV